MSNNPHEATPQELLAAENLKKDYIAHRQSSGRFKKLLAPWDKVDAWIAVVKRAHLRGVKGANIMPMLISANRDQPVMTWDIHRLMAGGGFGMVAPKNLLPCEADDMREIGLNPNSPEDVDKFHIREWLKGALRSIAGVAGTWDVNSNSFVHYLVYDITATHPFLRYLLGWKRPEVDRACGEEAREFFKKKKHLAKACVALGWPKEVIAPDFEI